MMHDEEVIDDLLDKIEALKAERDALKAIAFFPGMTLRDWFAGQALAGMLASRNSLGPRFHPADDAAYVYAVADAALKAREVKP
jgi:hypothetical protein